MIYFEDQRQQPRAPHPPQPGRPIRNTGRTWARWSMGLVCMSIAVYAVFTVFGIFELFKYSSGLSPDDAESAMQQNIDDIAMGILLPIDSVILFFMAAVVTVLHRGARKSEFGATRMTKAAMVMTIGSFVLSLFKFSVMFQIMFSMIGYTASGGYNAPTAGSSSGLHNPSTTAPKGDVHVAPTFTSLKPLMAQDAIGNLRASVTGVIDAASLERLKLEDGGLNTSGLMFELVRTDGVRLDMCFKAKVIAPDGSFTTGQYHSPVRPGEIADAVFVPHCDGS